MSIVPESFATLWSGLIVKWSINDKDNQNERSKLFRPTLPEARGTTDPSQFHQPTNLEVGWWNEPLKR